MSTTPARFYGWTVVASAFVVAVFGWGVGFYGPPIYLKEVQDARGWPVSLVSAAVTAHFLFGALIVANLPRLHRCLGLPATTIAGAALLALGVLGWAQAREPWQLFVASASSGAGWAALGGAAINAMVSPWFVSKRPAALAMAFNGASIGGVVFSPLWVALIAWVGFPAAAVGVGVVMLATIAALSMRVLSRTPADAGVAVDGEISPAAVATRALAEPARVERLWRDGAFITLALGMALGLFAQIGLIAHLFSLLVPALGAQGAGLAAGLATGCAIVGRTLVGWLMPAGADRRVVAGVNYGVQVLGCGAFVLAAGSNIVLLLLGVVLFGLGIGNATSLPPLIAQVEFAEADVARAVALVTAVAQATYAFAPAAFGLARDLSAGVAEQDAPAVFIAAAALQVVAASAYVVGRGVAEKR